MPGGLPRGGGMLNFQIDRRIMENNFSQGKLLMSHFAPSKIVAINGSQNTALHHPSLPWLDLLISNNNGECVFHVCLEPQECCVSLEPTMLVKLKVKIAKLK